MNFFDETFCKAEKNFGKKSNRFHKASHVSAFRFLLILWIEAMYDIKKYF